MTIRPATPDDAAGIARVYLDSAAHHQRLDSAIYCVPEDGEAEARYREGRQMPYPGVTLVAEDEEGIAGFVDAAIVHPHDAMRHQIPHLHVFEIAVAARRRGQGIGRGLLAAAEQWGREQGAQAASLDFNINNLGAEKLYTEGFGYRVVSKVALKRL